MANLNQWGENNHSWKGGVKKDNRGYVLIKLYDHPRANKHGYVFEHILIAEKALGKSLPMKAVVHHVNENTSDNTSGNLVICEDDNYHRLLHARLRAMKACGNPNWRKCVHCKNYDAPENLYIDMNNVRHRECYRNYIADRKQKRRNRG